MQRAKARRGRVDSAGVESQEETAKESDKATLLSPDFPGRKVILKARILLYRLPCWLLSLSGLFLLAVALWGRGNVRRNADAHNNRRRSKAHICYSKVHGELGTKVLLDQFGYEGIDATKDKDWDLIYGGYPHCGEFGAKVMGKEIVSGKKTRGKRRKMDWHMKSGLNRILNKRGWDKLKPHQVYFPCMGCSVAYCNKRELCRILRGIDPDLCYVLPDDTKRLKAAMAADKQRLWVLKIDAPDMHKHSGTGVKYIRTAAELPMQFEQKQGVYLVQPYNEPFLGKGAWRRKSEIRVYVALTSVYPLRAYVHDDSVRVILAAKEYTNATEAHVDACMHDTHSNTHKCDYQDAKFEKELENTFQHHHQGFRTLPLDEYMDVVGMSDSQKAMLKDSIHQLISEVLKAGHHEMEDHPINRGIQKSGASCFSHMRVDMGITTDGKPFIFEFPELHGLYRPDDAITQSVLDTSSVYRSIGELFHMVGLDEPPVPAERRAEFESTRTGGWKLLPNLD